MSTIFRRRFIKEKQNSLSYSTIEISTLITFEHNNRVTKKMRNFIQMLCFGKKHGFSRVREIATAWTQISIIQCLCGLARSSPAPSSSAYQHWIVDGQAA